MVLTNHDRCTRRTVLRTIGAGTLALIAGVTSGAAADGTDTTGNDEDADPDEGWAWETDDDATDPEPDEGWAWDEVEADPDEGWAWDPERKSDGNTDENWAW